MHRQMPGLFLPLADALCRVCHDERGELIQGMLRLSGRAYLPTLGVFQPHPLPIRMLPHQQHLLGLGNYDRTYKGCSYRIP